MQRKKSNNVEEPLLGCLCTRGGASEYLETMTVWEFLERVRNGYYRDGLDIVEECRKSGNRTKTKAMERDIPVFYPMLIPPSMQREGALPVNGVAVVTMSYRNVHDAVEAMEHLREWKFVLGYFTNVRGTLVVFIYVGNDFTDMNDYVEERDLLVESMNHALRKVTFRCRKRPVRGVWVSSDKNAYIRHENL